MYFFAIPTDRGLDIDSVNHDLDDSAEFEEVDVASGLVAWDEQGWLFHFEPHRDQEGAGWTVRSDGPDLERFVEVLRHFLLSVTGSRHHRRRASVFGIDDARLREGSRDELIDFVRRMNLVDEY